MRLPVDTLPRSQRRGYLVYARLGGAFQPSRGQYVKQFEADDGLNGNASWGCRTEAKLFRTLASAVACVLLVSEHTGVRDARVLDAQTQERIE